MSRPNFLFSVNNTIITTPSSPLINTTQINTYKIRVSVGQGSGYKQLKRASTGNNIGCSNCPSNGVPGCYCNTDSLGDAIQWGCPSGYTADIMGIAPNQYVNCVMSCGLNTCYGCPCN